MIEPQVVGAASSVFGRFDRSIVNHGADVVRAAIADAAVEPTDVDVLYVGNYAAELTNRQAGIAALIAHEAGTQNAVATRVEGICASGAIAFMHAVQAIRSRMARIAVAVGVEQLTAVPRAERSAIIAVGFDQRFEGRDGLTFPRYFAGVAREYMERYGLGDHALYAVAEHNHRRGALNPIVSRPRALTFDAYLESHVVEGPLRVLDCCGAVDGASAVVVSGIPSQNGRPSANVVAVSQTNGSGTAHGAKSRLSFESVRRAARHAMSEAGIAPTDIDVAEVHDAFTISQLIDLEDLGLFERGKGRDFLDQQDRLYVNPSGGLLARGHPIGATGVAQICELVAQLRGESHFQHPSPRWAMAQTAGGIDAHATVAILRAE
jgi:acetyl-CoA acetyltransferase